MKSNIPLLISGATIFTISSVVDGGIDLNLQNFSGNVYANSAIFTTMSFTANLSSGFLANRFGRKKMILITYASAAIPTAIYSIIDTQAAWANVFMFIAKLSMTANFNLTSLMAVESFQIQYRNTAYGIIEFVSLFFNLFLPILTEERSVVVTLVFSACSGLGIVAALFLPDKTN